MQKASVSPVLGVVRYGTRGKIPRACWLAWLANWLTTNSVRPCVKISREIHKKTAGADGPEGYCADVQEQTKHTLEEARRHKVLMSKMCFKIR